MGWLLSFGKALVTHTLCQTKYPRHLLRHISACVTYLPKKKSRRRGGGCPQNRRLGTAPACEKKPQQREGVPPTTALPTHPPLEISFVAIRELGRGGALMNLSKQCDDYRKRENEYG